ncbi:carbonic anhydrase [Streptomyces sp. NPDC005389]|uniref:carbonic anhydrase n=1 Tax=Streptomyces sp. NPDC005389 TaxID=3157040 RepID=UPI0033B93AFF
MQPLIDHARRFGQRPAGGIVPPYGTGNPSGEAATIEYAVEDVVVCGHSHCGAVGALVQGEDLCAVPAVRDRLAHAAPDGAPGRADDPAVTDAVHGHVLARLLRPRSHPCVGRRLAAGRLRLHGWFHEVHTGAVLEYRPESDAFEAL